MSHYELGSAPDQTTTAIKWPHDSLAAHLAVGVGSTAARYSDSGSPGGFAPLTHNHSGSAAATLRIPSLAASYSNNNSMGGSVYNRFLPALQPQPQPQPGLVTAPSTQQQSDAAQKLFAQLTNSANTTTTQHLSQFVNQQHHLYMAAAAEEAKLLDSSQKLIQDWRDRTSKLAVTTKPISNATSADQLWLDEQKTNLVHQLAQPYQKHLIQQRLTATTPPNITTSPPFIPQPQPPAHSPVRSSHSSTPSLLTPSASQQQQLATVQQHQSAAALVTAAASLLSTDERIGTNLSTSNTTLVETSRISIPDSTTTGTLIDGAKNGGAFTSFKHTSSSVIMQSHSSKGDAERDDIMEMNDQMNGVEHGAQIEDAPMKEVDSECAELMCGGSSSVGSSTKSDMDILDEETHVASSSNSSSSSNTIKDGSNQNVLNQKGDKELLLHALSNQQQLRSVLDYDVDENNGDDTMRTAVAQQNEHQIKGEKVLDEWTDEVKRRPSTDTTYIISNGTTQPKEEDSNSPSSLLLNLSQQQQRESVKNLSSSPIKTETSDSDINNNNNLNIGVDKQHHNQIVTTLAECHRIEEEPLLSEKLPTSCSVATPNSCTNSTSSVISTTSNSPPRSTPHSQPPLSISPVLAEITTSTPPTGSFCRAPGLGPLPIPDLLNSSSSSSSQLPLVCAICGFSCNSKFHYNSHMNTHGDHQCTMCDYTSRTEGRLKKHMRDSHTIQEQMAAGLDVEIIASSSQLFSSSSTSLTSNTQLGTTMTSVLEAANLAAATQLAAAMHAASSSSSTSPNYTSTPPSSTSDDHQTAITSSASHSLLPSALDQIRAFTENPSILPDLSSTNLASALMSHGLLGTAPPISEASTSSPTEEQQASASYSLTISGSSSERRSSGSKPKTYKCKQCSHVSASKEDQWVHARTHIPVEKQLGCTRCGFVTEYKHHLEYHLRNHMGSKPFHCKKCAYSCVNKSMLNSHMKSHTNVYQFRCRDCTYATKYCHSLKLHLKKYNHTRAGDANDSTVINGHHNTVSPFESANESDSLRRLSESYSMNGADEDTSPRPTSTIPTAQQSLANSTAMNLNPMVTSSSLNLASQLLLRQHQLEQMDVVMRMNGLSGGITPSAMLPNVSSTTTNSPAAVSRCALCNYQALNEEDNLRHQMTHLIAHQADPAATAASLYNSIASIQNCNNQPLTTTSPRVVNECDEKRRLSTSDGKLNDDDKEQMLERCFNNTSGDTHQTSPVESAKSSGDEGSLTAEEMCAEKGGGASKRKAGLKLNQIAARLHEKNSPGVDDMHIVDSTDCVTSERMDDDEKELSPLAVTLPISAPIASRPTPTRVLPTPLTFTTDTTNLNIFQQACIAHMQNMEQKLRSAFDMWRFSCPHCKMAFQDEPLFHIHMGYHGYENPFKCNRCGQACNDGLTFNLHLLQAKH